MTTTEHWTNRIVRYSEEAPDQLLAYPLNPKVHPHAQERALEGVINDLGVLAPVVCNERTQHVIDGHLRISLAISRAEPSIPVVWVDLPEALEALALATFDPIGALAAVDRDNLALLLAEAQPQDAAVRELLDTLAQTHGGIVLPEPGDQPEPQLPAEVLIEVYCSRADLDQFRATLDGWQRRAGVRVNIA